MDRIKNTVQLIGHVGTEPEIIPLKSGKRKAHFRMATNHLYKDTNGTLIENTSWHNISVFGKLVDIVEKFVPKGKEIGIEGRLSTRSYEAKDGSQRYFTEIICKELLLMGGSGKAAAKIQNHMPEV